MTALATATSPAPSYDYWRGALSGTFGAVHDGEAQPGFYRKRIRKGGPFVPVAIWHQEGDGMIAVVDGQSADAADIWSYVCQYPVTEEQYRQRVETGKWHDEAEAVTTSLVHEPANASGDPAEAMADQIDAALQGLNAYHDIRDDETASKAQSLRSRLLELSGEADKTRESEKKPHLEAGRAVDAKWQPLVKKAKEGADAIRKALGVHETRKDQERRAAEQARLKAEAEARAKQQAEAGQEATAPVPAPAPAPKPEPVQTQISGAYGRAATIKTKKVATVADQDAAYGFLKAHKEMIELIGKLAQRAVDAGYEVPGVTVEEVKEVR